MEERQNERKIHVSHVNVRLSISFLVLRLLVADSLVTVILIGLYTVLSPYGFLQQITLSSSSTIIGFIFITVIETILTVYIVLEWLNEYYEISSKAVTHKKGVIFKKEDRYGLQNIKQVRLEQGVFGRIFGYGTLNLFDWRLQKCAEMYSVHNPMRYMKILEELLPNVDEQRSTIREHIIEHDEDE